MITTTCGGCGKTLAVADEFAGRQARCPACGQIYTVPLATGPVSSGPLASGPDVAPVAPTLSPIDNPAPLDLGSPSSTFNSSEAANIGEGTTSSSGGVQYWMKAGNGAQYGPVDNATLGRWFSEGRVGADYQIRIGEYGHWQPASAFESVATGSLNMASSGVNPYAAVPTNFTPGVATSRIYPKSDQGGLVLAMGILAWIGGCPIFGIIAWVIGAQALRDINAGLADPSSRGIVQVGYYLGMVNIILCVCCGGLMMLGMMLSALAN